MTTSTPAVSDPRAGRAVAAAAERRPVLRRRVAAVEDPGAHAESLQVAAEASESQLLEKSASLELPPPPPPSPSSSSSSPEHRLPTYYKKR